MAISVHFFDLASAATRLYQQGSECLSCGMPLVAVNAHVGFQPRMPQCLASGAQSVVK